MLDAFEAIMGSRKGRVLDRREYLEQQLVDMANKRLKAQVSFEMALALGPEAYAIEQRDKSLEERQSWEGFVDDQQLLLEGLDRVVDRLQQLLIEEGGDPAVTLDGRSSSIMQEVAS